MSAHTWAQAIRAMGERSPEIARAMRAGIVRSVLIGGEVVTNPERITPAVAWAHLTNMEKHSLFERNPSAYRALRDAARRS